MDRQYHCNIILDLLPLSMEHLVSEETDKVIEQHLLTCESCRQIYEDMQRGIDGMSCGELKRGEHLSGNTDCSVVKDLLPLFLDNLTGRESEELIQTHLGSCQQCRDHLQQLKDERKVQSSLEDANDKRLWKALKKRRYEMLGIFCGILSCILLVAGLLVWVLWRGNTKEQKYDVREHYEQAADYGNQNYRGEAKLSLFPAKDGLTGEIEDFYYDCKGGWLHQEYQIYLECSYDASAYEAEKQRLLQVKNEETGQQVIYTEEENDLPCVYAMLYDDGYEYALLDEKENTVIYIYLQGIDRRELAFPEEYLPKDYGQAGYNFETERDGYSIYSGAERSVGQNE